MERWRLCFSWKKHNLYKGKCAFLSDQKGTKESPGDGSDERHRTAGAHSHLSPGPPVAGAGHFGLLVASGGLSFDRALSYSRPTGAYCHRNLQDYPSISHRLLPPFLLSAAVDNAHKNKKVGATENVTPIFHFVTGAEAKLRRKFFAKLSFKKA